ncbi:MAG TPA: hypothetical protein VFV52_15675 [Bacilli bacterium]|nr:hypothetical protein [Bacilli bacterium]
MLRYKGYHGTGAVQAGQIEKHHFKVNLTRTPIDHKPRKVYWLGSGVYFFENDPDQARNFAQLFHETPIVLECTIDISEDKIFDVTDPESEAVIDFEAAREILLAQAINRKLNIKMTVESLDQKVFDDICIREGYEAVRAYTYTPFGRAREAKAKSIVPNGIEICVRNRNLITERIRMEEW